MFIFHGPYLHRVTSEALPPDCVFVFQHLSLSAPLLLSSKFKMKCSHKLKMKKTQVKQDTYILAYLCWCPWYELIFPSPLICSQWTLCTVWDAEIKTNTSNELISNNILKLSFSSVSPKFSLAILCISLIRNMLFQSGHWHCRESYCPQLEAET